jgi:hypothetical protein
MVSFLWATVVSLVLVLSSGGSNAASGTTKPIQVRISLHHTRVVAGHSVLGTVTLTNTTMRRISVESCALNRWLQVGLKGDGYAYRASSSMIACPPSIWLAPGANRFPVTVSTTYDRCLTFRKESVTISPPCTVPLPAQKYSTTIFIVGLAHKTGPPRTATVTLLPRREPKGSPPSFPRCPNCPTHVAYGPTPIRR